MDLTGARWHKSSFSGENGNSHGCIEVAFLTDGQVALRDSKDRALTPHVYDTAEWHRFVAGVRAGDF